MKKWTGLILSLFIVLALCLPSYALNRVQLSPEYFPNPISSKALSNADIYVGEVDLDPEVLANRKQVSVLQENGTIVAVSQPIKTGLGGTPVYNGSPVTMLVNGSYSLKVLNSYGAQVYYIPSSTANVQLDGSIENFNDLRDIPFTPSDGETVVVLGHTTRNDGGGDVFIWDDDSVLSDNNGTIIKVDSIATGRFIRPVKGFVTPEMFGGVGDFNPTTGVGTDIGDEVRATIAYAKTLAGGCNIVFSSGKRYLIGGVFGGDLATSAGTNMALLINDCDNINIIAYGAEVYHNNVDRAANGFLNWKAAKNCGWFGGKLFGCTTRDGVTVGSLSDSVVTGLTPSWLSRNITIKDVYITNFPGESIAVRGAYPGSSVVGYTAADIKIQDCTLKEHYGNGDRTSSGTGTGSWSRNALAIIDAKDVQIQGCTIYGRMDFEPNTDGQSLEQIKLANNIFESGYVQPQAVLGTLHWYDEPLGEEGDAGAAILPQDVTVIGLADAPLIKNIEITNNSFDISRVSFGAFGTYNCVVANNSFKSGKIDVGNTSGTNISYKNVIKNNHSAEPISGEASFIELVGSIYNSIIQNNSCQIDAGYCVSEYSAGLGDKGNNFFSGNTNLSATAAGSCSVVPYYKSIYKDNIAPAVRVWNKNIELVGGTSQVLDFSQIATAADSGVIRLTFTVDATGGNNADLTQITNIPSGVLIFITPLTGTSQTVTLKYNASYMRLNGNVDFAMSRTNGQDGVVLQSIGSIMYEVSRTETP